MTMQKNNDTPYEYVLKELEVSDFAQTQAYVEFKSFGLKQMIRTVSARDTDTFSKTETLLRSVVAVLRAQNGDLDRQMKLKPSEIRKKEISSYADLERRKSELKRRKDALDKEKEKVERFLGDKKKKSDKTDGVDKSSKK